MALYNTYVKLEHWVGFEPTTSELDTHCSDTIVSVDGDDFIFCLTDLPSCKL